MSRESWLAEFYPTPANRATKVEAVGHSLQKWKGLTKESLAKHELIETPIAVNCNSCSLCCIYTREDITCCRGCPIKIHTGLTCSGSVGHGYHYTQTPWLIWFHNKDPQPMIDLLQLLKDKEDGKDQGSVSSP